MVESRLLGGLGQVVARVSFLPTLAWNMAMERLSGRRWWDRVDHRVILGTAWGWGGSIDFFLPLQHTVQLSIGGKNGEMEGILKGNGKQKCFLYVQRFKGPAILKHRLPSTVWELTGH